MEAPTVESIPDAPRYYPFQSGRYEVKAGMVNLGYDFGNGEKDKQVLQLDASFNFYRQAKLNARSENLAKYFQIYNYDDTVSREIVKFLITRLLIEHPQYFHWSDFSLTCHLTQETLDFDEQYNLRQITSSLVTPKYISGLDAIACQIQEDIAVVCCDNQTSQTSQTGNNWASAIHLCFPNHWSAASKIGRDFITIHLPVGEIEPINKRAAGLVKAMIHGKPAVRFAWGISTDTRLNHHPEPVPGIDPAIWQGRKFVVENPQLYLRIERQTIWGLPQVNAALFTIRTYFYDCATIRKDTYLCHRLINAIASMSDESLDYKGLTDSKADILQWLNQALA